MTETTEKKLLHQPRNEQTPKLPFDEARRGLQLLAHDIGTYVKKNPDGTVVRTLSTLQIVLVIAFLIGVSYIVIWLMANFLRWPF